MYKRATNYNINRGGRHLPSIDDDANCYPSLNDKRVDSLLAIRALGVPHCNMVPVQNARELRRSVLGYERLRWFDEHGLGWVVECGHGVSRSLSVHYHAVLHALVYIIRQNLPNQCITISLRYNIANDRVLHFIAVVKPSSLDLEK